MGKTLRMNKTGKPVALTTGNLNNQKESAYHIICWECMGVDYSNSLDWINDFMLNHRHKNSVRAYMLMEKGDDLIGSDLHSHCQNTE